uniref:Uncharacterized protein n=1 Tax=Romanomermis culicivorax TaxID=13658 RepID=A0A915JWR1_ROMCU
MKFSTKLKLRRESQDQDRKQESLRKTTKKIAFSVISIKLHRQHELCTTITRNKCDQRGISAHR